MLTIRFPHYERQETNNKLVISSDQRMTWTVQTNAAREALRCCCEARSTFFFDHFDLTAICGFNLSALCSAHRMVLPILAITMAPDACWTWRSIEQCTTLTHSGITLQHFGDKGPELAMALSHTVARGTLQDFKRPIRQWCVYSVGVAAY